MALNPVTQLDDSGCFIASVAMLLGKEYQDAFRLLHPGKKAWSTIEHGFIDLSVKNAALRMLRGLGFQAHASSYKKFRTYRKRVNKNAIMIIRWDYEPTRCHCIVFDGDTKHFIEPDGGYVITSKYKLRRLQEQLDCAIVIDKTPSHCWIRS
jgi:hypothetical protein